MQQSFDIFFASSNKNKFKEAENILQKFGIKLGFFYCNLEEIQSDSINEIAINKVKTAYKLCKKPIIVEDDGLFISSLKGFPGPYSSYVFKTIGNHGILKLVTKNRHAKFHSIIAFCNKNSIKIFEANLSGKISTKISGKGWGYDPIFIPKGQKKTFGILEEKNKISHRFLALKKFSNWYLNK